MDNNDHYNIKSETKKGDNVSNIFPVEETKSKTSIYLQAEFETDFQWNDGTTDFSKCYQVEKDLKSIMEENTNIEQVTLTDCHFKQENSKSKVLYGLTIVGTSKEDIVAAASQTIKSVNPDLYKSLSSRSAISYSQKIVKSTKSINPLHVNAEIETDFNWNDGTSDFSKCYQLEMDLKSIMEKNENIVEVTMTECKLIQNGTKVKSAFSLTIDGSSSKDITDAASIYAVKTTDSDLYGSLSSRSVRVLSILPH